MLKRVSLEARSRTARVRRVSGRLVSVAALVVLAGVAGHSQGSPQASPPGREALREAKALAQSGMPDALRASLAALETLAVTSRAGGDAALEAEAVMALGDVQQRLSDFRSARASYERALALTRSRADRGGEALALNALAGAYGRLSEYQHAIDTYRQALPLLRELESPRGEAAALSGMGGAYLRLNLYSEARDALERAVSIYRRLGDPGGESAALQQIGSAEFSQDQYAAAIATYDRAVALARTAGSRALEAAAVYATGQVHYHLGDYQKALDLYGEALAAHRATLNRSGEAAALSALGRVYRFLGDYPQALAHHDRALAILRAIGERMNEATSLNNTGHVYLSMREPWKALPFFVQSLEICRVVGNQSGIASNTNGIGLVHAGAGEFERALPFHHDALQLFRAIGHRRAEADSLAHIGRAHHGLGQYEPALEHLRAALAIYREIGVPRQQSETLHAMARTGQAAGDLTAAETDIDAAIELAERFRQDVSNQGLRSSYLASVRDLYELRIDVLMEGQRRQTAPLAAARAFETSERARARSLLDLLAEARADIRSGVDPALLERERAARQLLAGRAERQTQLTGGASTPGQRAAIAAEVDAAVSALQDVQTTIREQSPRYAALMQPEPLTLRQVQDELLDPETVLLEYFLGDDRSYVWVVTQESIDGVELEPRRAIETAARRFHDLAKDKASSAALDDAAGVLSAMVLRPVADQLRGKRLAIVADGALHYVPFAALPKPDGATASDRGAPLVVQHEIVTLPSASALAMVRRDEADRARATKLIAVVADPVFDADDVRVRRRAASAPGAEDSTLPHAGVRRSIEEIGLGVGQWPPPRLIGTRQEARAILALAPPGVSQQALDFDANRETATAETLGQFQIIHFATHALINNRHPELSGLVLSLVDRNGRPRDGFLRLNDIFNLRLPAQLVVLSACQTGLGQEVQGEGLIGLTRGFMYAGAARLLTSLWPVDDRGTSELMRRFYRGLLQKRLSASAALRQAQIEMLGEKDWQSPYQWASFTLQGDWRAPTAGPSRRH